MPINQLLNRLTQRYARALQRHLQRGAPDGLRTARALGQQAAALRLETLDVARMHEVGLAGRDAAGHPRRAESFFAEAITPIEQTHRAAKSESSRLDRLERTLERRAKDLATANRFLKRGIAQRKTAERALKKSAEHYARLAKESHRLQRHLRQLTHQILAAQELERTRTSRGLHDQMVQTLVGIDLRLLSLKTGAAANALGLKKEIASTQRLVKHSVERLRRFSREFRHQHES